jgi:hypothetical protein
VDRRALPRKKAQSNKGNWEIEGNGPRLAVASNITKYIATNRQLLYQRKIFKLFWDIREGIYSNNPSFFPYPPPSWARFEFLITARIIMVK